MEGTLCFRLMGMMVVSRSRQERGVLGPGVRVTVTGHDANRGTSSRLRASCYPPTAEFSWFPIQWSHFPSFYQFSSPVRHSPKPQHRWRRSLHSRPAPHSLSQKRPSIAPPHNHTSRQIGVSPRAASKTVPPTSYLSKILSQMPPRPVTATATTPIRPVPCCR